MKKFVITLFILSNLIPLCFGAEYKFLRSTGAAPLGATISKDQGHDRVILQSIDSKGNVSFISRMQSGASDNTIGRIKAGETLIYRIDDNHPAVRIKVIEVNLENGYAVLEVSTFWPEPNK